MNHQKKFHPWFTHVLLIIIYYVYYAYWDYSVFLWFTPERIRSFLIWMPTPFHPNILVNFLHVIQYTLPLS